MWTGALVVTLAACACAITRDQFYPHGHGLDQRLPRGADVSSPEIQLTVPIVFYGETYRSTYVNNYGVITFITDISTFLNAEFPLPYPSIAAFYSNIDTSEVGTVYYRETNDSYVLLKAEESVQNNFHDYYDFRPTSVFIATWIDVTYLSTERQNRQNSFQTAIISNGTETFVEFLYPEREIQWIQGEIHEGGLPDAKAQAGFIAEDGRVFTLRGSGSHQIRNIVSWSNTHEPGRYVFRVGNISTEGNIAVPDQYDQYEAEVEEESKTCAQSGPSVCHLQARCVDYQAGICCQCNDGFYGNGKSCIKDDVPLRVHGKLNGVINNINLNDVDIQAYVVVVDGRSYTALSNVPPSLGSSLQLLNVLGRVVGWLFAKPSREAQNGYQLTGGYFNHTAEIYFPISGERVSINQEYVGHDVFDQITLETDIRGTIPVVLTGSKLEISEDDEQYTIVDVGVIHTSSSRTFTNKMTGETYEQRVTQTFTYSPCKFAPQNEDDNKLLTLKVKKNYLGYEARGNIVRYGTTNKIQSNVQENPCEEGRYSCDSHSTCVAQGDSFTCVCQSGFTSINIGNCVDIDECGAGTHNCDVNADCYNYDGGFQCRCREGYEGNGVRCDRISTCRDEICDPNAQCVENLSEGPVCLCNSGFTGNGKSCWVTYHNVCSNCSPNAHCEFSEQLYSESCYCNTGFVGDGQSCIEDTTTEPYKSEPTEGFVASIQSTTPAVSESEYNETYFLANCESYGCVCPSGYSIYKDERNNDLCRRDGSPEYPDIEDNNQSSNSITCTTHVDCPPNAICAFDYYSADEPVVGHCICPEGYEGDAYECIERSGPSCSCGPAASCVETVGGLICVCDAGYMGDGYTCRPNFSCTNNSDCELNAECRPAPSTNEYVCQCVEGYIKDESDACIPDGQLCSGVVCAEHASCLYDDAIGVSYCHCNDGYEGEGISRCVPQGRTCDVANDCDPNAECKLTEVSYQCICREGFNGDGYTCTPEQNCKFNIYACDEHAFCLKTNQGYECKCISGYNGNGNYCELSQRQAGNFLVASDGASVYRVPFTMTPREFAAPINSGVNQTAVGIDVDCLDEKIYWGDIAGNAIKRAEYDGSGYESFLSKDVVAPEGISVDWSARNIFWTDSRKLSIEVANIDTKVRKVLFQKDGIHNPRGIAAHPGKGKIFWSDWYRGGPKIEWANMDGSQRGVFLDQLDVTLPNSLAIDWSRDRLCYSDAGKSSINCVDIDTLEKETIAVNCLYPFGLAISGDTFYWTDWRTLKIESINNLSKLKDTVSIATYKMRYGLTVAPKQCPAHSNICHVRNGNCYSDQLCLPNGDGGRTCVSGDNNGEYLSNK